jgi:uncharacterized protein RhaS with RHS repeats
VQSDPIGLEGGINTYAYTKNSPIMSVDPTGLDPAGGPATGPRQPTYPGLPSFRPFQPGTSQTRDAANAIVNFVNQMGSTIKNICGFDDIMMAEEETLSAAEEEAIRAKNAGQPYDKETYNRARKKQIKNEKYAKQRNKQKRGG